MSIELLIGSITLFVLSIFLGVELITKVPAMLHLPMSGANAISELAWLERYLSKRGYEGGETVSGILYFIGIAMINVAGGFVVTNRMPNMIAERIEFKMSEDWISLILFLPFYSFCLKKYLRTAPKGNQYGMMGMAVAVLMTIIDMNYMPDGIVG